jgi:hypothetical protein
MARGPAGYARLTSVPVPSWRPIFSPHYRWASVPAVQVQEAQRRCFYRWGCPQVVRVDNGIPWGNSSGLPSVYSLWLAGLGVEMRWNKPYRPEQNGVVENSQGVTQRWAEPGSCANLEELQRRVEHEDYIQRERYPSINGMSRRMAYPGLLHSGRGYCLNWEKQVWEMGEALRFLGRYQVRRKVSKRGQVSAYHRLIEVGRQYSEQWVYLGMDGQSGEWVIRDVQGQEIRRRPAPQLTAEAIVGLVVH